MIKNWKAALAALVLSVSAFGAGAVFTGAAHAAPLYAVVRPDRGSDRNLRYVDARLGALIDQLQRDQREYDGHRVAAIADMQQARGQLAAAMRYDAGR